MSTCKTCKNWHPSKGVWGECYLGAADSGHPYYTYSPVVSMGYSHTFLVTSETFGCNQYKKGKQVPFNLGNRLKERPY